MYTSARATDKDVRLDVVEIHDVKVNDNVTLYFQDGEAAKTVPRLIIRYETGPTPTVRILIDQLGTIPVSIEHPKADG